ncbi:MAG: 23S rRNA (adenine(2030)-N(6))-methyltransferase RlmJ [Cardiobacteriaceae bacterium]|nr:23S rRNA (adenine(2030)-N(6))-methyltransferase RlmJ [Cardiobacteriaceae bacterium]
MPFFGSHAIVFHGQRLYHGALCPPDAMLSYRHAFHAGNHADVLKHYIFWQILDYYRQKDKPFVVIDTHAGAGLYDLGAAEAQKNHEYRQGIARLRAAKTLSAPLAAFLRAVDDSLPESGLYPGSPWLVASLLREADRLHAYELHPRDHEHLAANLAHFRLGRRLRIARDNGFKGLIGELPPATRRAVVLIDPPYEDKNDYQQVFTTLVRAQKRFASGCYIVWYPALQNPWSAAFAEELALDFGDNYLHARLDVCAPSADGYGMHGSGLFIVNPPWTLAADLEERLPELQTLLAQDKHAAFQLDFHIP